MLLNNRPTFLDFIIYGETGANLLIIRENTSQLCSVISLADLDLCAASYTYNLIETIKNYYKIYKGFVFGMPWYRKKQTPPVRR